MIQGFAKAMYSRAALVVGVYTVLGILFFGTAGLTIGDFTGSAESSAMVGGIIGGFLGYWFGNMKANALRLEAQVALCQVEIEKNTRG